MSKIGLMLTSLVVAIPGAFLAYLLVMAFLSHAEAMTTMVQALAGGTLLLSALLVFMPAGILIFGPKEKELAAEEQASDAPQETATEDEDANEAMGFNEGDEEDLVEEDGDEDIVMAEDEGEEVDFADDLSDDAVEIADVDSSDDIFSEEDDAHSDFDLDFDEDENQQS